MSPWQHDWFHMGSRIVSGRQETGGGAYVEGTWNPWVTFAPLGEYDDVFPSVLHDNWLTPLSAHEFYTDQVASTRVLNKLSQQKMQLGVTLLEMKQTAGLTMDLAKALTKGVVQVCGAKGKFSRRSEQLLRRLARGEKPGDILWDSTAATLKRDRSILEDTQNAWMQYSFGLKPLVGDVHNAFNALYESKYGEKKAFLVSAKAGYTTEHASRKFVGNLSPGGTTYAVCSETVSVHYSVVYEMPEGGIPMSTLLGLNDGVATAWEVTKLSWMFDYVVGIGDMLQSWNAANGLSFREGSKSVLKRSTILQYEVERDPAQPYTGQEPPPDYLDVGSFRRTMVNAPGVVPAFLPQVKRKLGLKQLGQSIFALTQWLGGKSALR